MSMLMTVTMGAIVGYVVLVVVLLACAVVFVFALLDRDISIAGGATVVAVVGMGLWWWGMAFTTSSDYHAWNAKAGKVEQIAKRQIATDNGMSERYVLRLGGVPYGVDDTRAALAKVGDEVNLLCKKDYQWGLPRPAQGWVCRWNGVAS